MKADVTTLDAKKAGSVDLDEAIFGLEPRQDLLHRMVAYQLAARRAGTRRTKTRGEIMGSTRKIVRQKGSGGARHGNRKASLFRGGAKAFGPVVRDHAIAMPKKVRALALKHALSSKAKGDALIVLDEAKVEAAKTGPLRKQLGGLGIGSALIIDGQVDDNFAVAARNIPNVDVLPVQGINVYDILRRDTLVLTKAALEGLEARFK